MKIHTLKISLNDNDNLEILEAKTLKEANDLNLNEHYFLLFKALQFNEYFIQDIIRLRKIHGIDSNGLDSNEILHQVNEVVEGKSDKPLTNKINQITKDSMAMLKYFNLRNIDDFDQIMPNAIAEITLYNSVLMGNYDSIRLYHDEEIDKESGIPEIHIVIGAETSRRSLELFIDKKWAIISKIQKNFQKPNRFKVSERDLIVYDLIKHDHLKLTETLDSLEKIYPNEVFNYDQIKGSHKNLKDKIASLYKK